MVLNKGIEFTFEVTSRLAGDTSVVRNGINKLFKETLMQTKLGENQKLIIIFKVCFENNTVRSITTLQEFKVKDLSKMKDIFNTLWLISSNEYHQTPVSHLIFYYKIIDVNKNSKSKIIDITTIYNTKKLETIRIYGQNNLPTTMDITLWGDYKFNNEFTKCLVSKLNFKGAFIFTIELSDNYYKVTVKVKGKVILNFVDIMDDRDNLATFTRCIGNKVYKFIDGKLVLSKFPRHTSFMKVVKASKSLSSKFPTMDLETRTINGTMVPYCVSIYDGLVSKSFYLSDLLTE
jgi:hypothetical protein